MIYSRHYYTVQVLAEKPLKDQYTLIECSNTLIEQSDRFILPICSQHQGCNCAILKLVYLIPVYLLQVFEHIDIITVYLT